MAFWLFDIDVTKPIMYREVRNREQKTDRKYNYHRRDNIRKQDLQHDISKQLNSI